MVTKRLLIFLLTPAIGLFAAAPAAVPGTGVEIAAPVGMERAERFAGFQSKTETASLMIVELPAPPSQTGAGFRDPAKLASQRMTLISTEKIQTGSGETELFVMNQRHAGSEYYKLVLLLGDAGRTAILTASCDIEQKAHWDPLIRDSFQTARLVKTAAGGAGFTITPKGDFKEAKAMTNSLAFTPGGQFPVKDPATPLFIATRSFAPQSVPSLEQFAITRAKSLPGSANLKITESKPITIAGLEGHELTGTDPAKGLMVYQVLLRETGGGYYLLVGTVSESGWPAALPLFREMSTTFRLE